LAPSEREDDGSKTAGSGVQVTIDAHADSYEQAVAALRAAYVRGSEV
jgi:hypothetical protein